jgi:hypothetical protein
MLVFDNNLEGCRVDFGEAPVYVRVVARVGVFCLEPETVAVHVPGLVITYTFEFGGRILRKKRLG